jgi:hypothetical protein
LKRLTSPAHDDGFNLPPDNRRVIEAQRTLDKATDFEGPEPKLHKGESGLLDAIENRRRRARELKAAAARIAASPFPSSYCKQRLREQVEQLSLRGAVSVSLLVEHDGKIESSGPSGQLLAEAEFSTKPFGRLENIKVYVMMTESSASRLQRGLRRIRLSKPVREPQRSSKCDQKALAP